MKNIKINFEVTAALLIHLKKRTPEMYLHILCKPKSGKKVYLWMKDVETQFQIAKPKHIQTIADPGTEFPDNANPQLPGWEGSAHSVAEAHLWM